MQSRQIILLVTLGLITLMAAFRVAHAQGYDPIIENFRLGADDQLTIDRGGPVDRAGDVNGDNLEDILVGAGVGGIRVIFGPTRGNNGVLNGQQLDGTSGFVILNDEEFDSVLAGIGDINGDGLDDIAVGSLTGTRVIYGSDEGFSRTFDVASLDGSNGFVFGSAATDLKRAGDVNGDGLDDFIVGNANASPNGLNGAGVSYVIFGSRNGLPATLSPAALDGSNGFAIIGVSAEDRSGLHVAGAGDFNHDGFDDVLIGAPYQTTDGKAEAGAAYLVLGGDDFPAALSLADLDGGNGMLFKGSNIQDVAGAAVGGIGDINHDGIDDIAIGAPGKGPFGVPSDYPGETHVLFGGHFEGVATVVEDDLNGINGLVIRGIRGGVIPIEEGQAIWGDMAGADLDAAGDINGDGIDDLLIGAPHTIINPRRKGVGQAYFVFGSEAAFPARLNLSDLDGSNGFRINGTGTVDYYAVSVASAGDFNADGRDDVMMGASGQGETYVFYGKDTGNAMAAAASPASPGTPSTGFPAAALSLGSEAEPLAFNERADPTGPEPLPPGTPTDPTNPLTPGYQAPHPFNDAPPARPDADSGDTGGTTGGSTGTDGGNDGDDATGGGSDTDSPPTSTTGGDTDNNGAVVTGGGAAFGLPLLLLLMTTMRRNRGSYKQAR
ncbi:integrin alpha [Granulosicoccus sp. 3-233]|uniref:integrin alpha n=1 Tax=Granulosicoccus sp. 3-233 TaxID=3417969 RepID=UPI003D349F25